MSTSEITLLSILVEILDCSLIHFCSGLELIKIVSGYDQEMTQSQTADKPMAPRERATQPTRDTKEDKPSKATGSPCPIKMMQNVNGH